MNNNKPEWLTEAENHIPDYILPSDAPTWKNIFRARASMQSDPINWEQAAQEAEQIWKERGLPRLV